MKQGHSIALQVKQCKKLDQKIQSFIKIKKNSTNIPSFLGSSKAKLQFPEKSTRKVSFKKSLTDWRSLYVSPQIINNQIELRLPRKASKQVKAQTQFHFFKKNTQNDKQIQMQRGKLQKSEFNIEEYKNAFSRDDRLQRLISKRAVSTQLSNSRIKKLKEQNDTYLIQRIRKKIQRQNDDNQNSRMAVNLNLNPQKIYNQFNGLEILGKNQNKKFRATHKISRDKSWTIGINNCNTNAFNKTTRVFPTKFIVQGSKKKDKTVMFDQEISYFKINKRKTSRKSH